MIVIYNRSSGEIVAWGEGLDPRTDVAPGQAALTVTQPIYPGDWRVDITASPPRLVAYAPALTWDHVRAQRNTLIQQSDWTQLPDASLDVATQSAWRIYRQQLRDIPASATAPDRVQWPTKPGAAS